MSRRHWSDAEYGRDLNRQLALAGQVDESRGRFMQQCDSCGRSFVGSRHADTCPACQQEDEE